MLLWEHGEKLYGHIDVLAEELGGPLGDMIESHGIQEMLNALADDNVSYHNNEMTISVGEGSGEIRVNLTTTIEAYNNGLAAVEQQKEIINRFFEYYETGIVEEVETKKNELVTAFNEMESNPRSYRHLLTKSNAPAGSLIERIVVHEQMPALMLPEHEVWIAALQEQVEKQRSLLERMREGIELIFDEEHQVAAIFQLSQ